MSATTSFELVQDPVAAGAPGRGRASILVPSVKPAASSSDSGTSTFTQTADTVSNLSTFDIRIIPSASLSSNAAALAAFERAAAQWESRISDPATVNINADLSNLGSATIIGQTQSVTIEDAYGTVRDAMVADAANEVDDAIVGSLPAAGNFVLPSRFTYSGKVSGTKAAMKALGFTGLDAQFGASDADIKFNSGFAFDYDNSDGVSAGKMDFETVAAHEIGHALGFTSIVDTVDYYARSGTGVTVPATTLDMFRFADNVTGADPQTAGEFASFPRSLQPNVAAVTDGIGDWDLATAENAMSTGAYTGDGQQASHWKDGDLTGKQIGILDPTLAYQQVSHITDADWRALDLIGWDINTAAGSSEPAPNAAPIVQDDAAVTDKATAITISAPGVLSNDRDPDGDPLVVTAATGTTAQGATFAVNADGSYSYDPRGSATLQALAAGYTAQDSFAYEVSDGRGGVATGTVNMSVTGSKPGDGPTVSYFSDDKLSRLVRTQVDPDGVIAEDWGNGSPVSVTDNFSVRWRGQLTVPADGNYTFYAKCDDNVRLWIDDPTDGVAAKLLIRRWGTANPSEFTTATPLRQQPGVNYTIQMDFREISGGASAYLRWASTNPDGTPGLAKQIVPKANLYSTTVGAVLTDPYLADKDRKNDNTTVGVDNGNGSTSLAPSVSPSRRPSAKETSGGRLVEDILA
jgi:VCBS repeat-containing protein